MYPRPIQNPEKIGNQRNVKALKISAFWNGCFHLFSKKVYFFAQLVHFLVHLMKKMCTFVPPKETKRNIVELWQS